MTGVDYLIVFLVIFAFGGFIPFQVELMILYDNYKAKKYLASLNNPGESVEQNSRDRIIYP
jgi:hypothetical protein